MNRNAVITLIKTGRMHGFLAYRQDRPIAWCHADLRKRFERLHDLFFDEDDAKKIAAIVCYIVAPDYRRKGVATKLLEHAIREFQKQECEILEAYPKQNSDSDAENYHGPLKMYLDHGFELTGGNEVFAVVRKSL